jgi:hypothetical protein
LIDRSEDREALSSHVQAVLAEGFGSGVHRGQTMSRFGLLQLDADEVSEPRINGCSHLG